MGKLASRARTVMVLILFIVIMKNIHVIIDVDGKGSICFYD